MPNSQAGKARQREDSIARRRELRNRGRLRINRAALVGRWRSKRGPYIKFFKLAPDGALTGGVLKGKKQTATLVGKWNVADDCLVFDDSHDLLGGEKGVLYLLRTVIMKVARRHLVIAVGPTTRERYVRVTEV